MQDTLQALRLVSQDGHGFYVRFSIVNDYRLAEFSCQFQLSYEHFPLLFRWRKIAVEIQADFADGDHCRVLAEARQVHKVSRVNMVRFMRMYAHCGTDTWMLLGNLHSGEARMQIAANGYDHANTSFEGPRDDLNEITAEPRRIQMGMRVNENQRPAILLPSARISWILSRAVVSV